jgi:hypothetical protein
MGTVVEETDETLFWLELIEDTAIYPASKVEPLKREAEALLKIFSSSLGTARKNRSHS